MDMKSVYDFIDYFERSSLTECNLEIEGVKLGLKKGMPVPETASHTVGLSENAVATAHTESKDQMAEETNTNEKCAIKAPLVGTFYRAGAPGEEPFVSEGQQVKAGDVVGIIEAMKMMNEIVAPSDGTVECIVAKDGEMVDYDKVLMYLTK